MTDPKMEVECAWPSMRPAPRTNRRTTAAALVLWGSMAVAVGTGCIPIYTPLVVQDITTGEKLSGIEMSRKSLERGENSIEHAARCDEVRALLLASPPRMTALAYAPPNTTPDGWCVFNPGLYSPVDRERSDLERAHDAGLINDAECAELNRVLEIQASKRLFRRGFETADVGLDGTVSGSMFGTESFSTWSDGTRMVAVRAWGNRWVALLRQRDLLTAGLQDHGDDWQDVPELRSLASSRSAAESKIREIMSMDPAKWSQDWYRGVFLFFPTYMKPRIPLVFVSDPSEVKN